MPAVFLMLYAGFWLLVVLLGIAGLVYVIANRYRQKEREDFEQRDN